MKNTDSNEFMQVYGQRDPPEYIVESVKVPVATYRGKNDYLTSEEVGTRGCNKGILLVLLHKSLEAQPSHFINTR